MTEPHAHQTATAEAAHSHVGRYLMVWAALMVLTATTWGLSTVHIPGGAGVAVALGIAGLKASLVALFFMHLYDQRGPNRLVFVTSLVFVTLQESNEIAAIDLKTQAVEWKMAVGRQPAGIWTTPDDRYLIVGMTGDDYAEVIDWRELLEIGSWDKARAAKKLRVEGKDYEVRDGDVLEIRFNV